MRGVLLVPLALMACQEIQISGGTSLSASGDAPDLSTPTQTDVTKQTKIPEVDILWVVDNSGSMAESCALHSLTISARSCSVQGLNDIGFPQIRDGPGSRNNYKHHQGEKEQNPD